MSAPIDYAVLAELAEALHLPGAAHLRESAGVELLDALDAASELDNIYELLDRVPAGAVSAKHSDTCWQRHARCLADRIAGFG